ncbi:MAG: general secretion pathway protein GspJ [Deltaproteobacteria bacterium]|nr:general secretion pathway protein GspJ [Deltaproteobacteria bacterium]
MRPSSRHLRHPAAWTRGLTLLEVVLAVGVLAVIATLTWGSIARSFDAYETVIGIDGRYHSARVAMNRMAKEFSMAFLTSERRNNGKEKTWVTHFKSEPGSPFQTVNFIAFAHEILRADAKECDQAEIGYRGEPDPDDQTKLNLVRREDPRPDIEWDEGGRSYVLAEDIKDFKLRFFDPTNDDWTDAWDTEKAEFAGRLPTIIEITLVMEDENGEPLTFVTKTRVNLIKELDRT